MNFFKMILAIGLVASCAMNVAMAAAVVEKEVWCGYIGPANPPGSDPNFTTKGKVLQNAQYRCTQKDIGKKIAMVNSPFYKDMGHWAKTCMNAQDKIGLQPNCNKFYAYLFQEQPKFDKTYVYPADYQHNVSTAQFCDVGGTNPNNMTDYSHNTDSSRNSDECACVAGFSGVKAGEKGVGPYSWTDTVALKGAARDGLNTAFRDIKDIDIIFAKFKSKEDPSYSNQYSNQNLSTRPLSIPGGLTPAQCCVAVGGIVVADGQINNGNVKGPSCQSK